MIKNVLRKLAINYFPNIEKMKRHLEEDDVQNGLNLVPFTHEWKQAFNGYHSSTSAPVCTLPNGWNEIYIVFRWGDWGEQGHGHTVSYAILVNGIDYRRGGPDNRWNAFTRYGIGSINDEGYFKVEADNKLYLKGRGAGYDAEIIQVLWR